MTHQLIILQLFIKAQGIEENKYYSFIGDYCNGKYPYFLEGTKLCLRNCSEFIMFNIMEIVLTLIKTKPKEFKLHLLY